MARTVPKTMSRSQCHQRPPRKALPTPQTEGSGTQRKQGNDDPFLAKLRALIETAASLEHSAAEKRRHALSGFRDLWERYAEQSNTTALVHTIVNQLSPSLQENLSEIVLSGIKPPIARHVRKLGKSQWELTPGALYAVFGDDAFRSERFMAALRDLADREEHFDIAWEKLERHSRYRRARTGLELPGVDSKRMWQPWDAQQAIKEYGNGPQDRNRRNRRSVRPAGGRATSLGKSTAAVKGTAGPTEEEGGEGAGEARESAREEDAGKTDDEEDDDREKEDDREAQEGEDDRGYFPSTPAPAPERVLTAGRKEEGGEALGGQGDERIFDSTPPLSADESMSEPQASSPEIECGRGACFPPAYDPASEESGLGLNFDNSPSFDNASADDNSVHTDFFKARRQLFSDSHDLDLRRSPFPSSSPHDFSTPNKAGRGPSQSLSDDDIQSPSLKRLQQDTRQHQWHQQHTPPRRQKPQRPPPPRPPPQRHPTQHHPLRRPQPKQPRLRSQDHQPRQLLGGSNLLVMPSQSGPRTQHSNQRGKRSAPQPLQPEPRRQKPRNMLTARDIIRSWFRALPLVVEEEADITFNTSTGEYHVLSTSLVLHGGDRVFAVNIRDAEIWCTAHLIPTNGMLRIDVPSDVDISDDFALEMRRKYARHSTGEGPTVELVEWSGVDKVDTFALVAHIAFDAAFGGDRKDTSTFVPDLWHAILQSVSGSNRKCGLRDPALPPQPDEITADSQRNWLKAWKKKARALAGYSQAARRVRELLSEESSIVEDADTTQLEEDIESLEKSLAIFRGQNNVAGCTATEAVIAERRRELESATKSAGNSSEVMHAAAMAASYVELKYRDRSQQCLKDMAAQKESMINACRYTISCLESVSENLDNAESDAEDGDPDPESDKE